MTLVPETWVLAGRAEDPATGYPSCYVARRLIDFEQRYTVWKLVQYPEGWRAVGQFISKGKFRQFPESKGVKLSDSRIDQILLQFAEEGYAHV